ncbi:mitochondrial small ribosomal subunit [Hirsutella rhossiliensis]|uniref:Mitochondrial small ribosomal subunit n=1 Tax=Hirsutella rhossiliensis TaxID=111463 RepID=A0A9P8N385_9HYPO|nr:mitochondrial small ribosomal subunit [Hirsutella rhossiliensis]KAH0963897.1 mitochondrial small ribosomal subunit [Hirsutella rhossiliensis]
MHDRSFTSSAYFRVDEPTKDDIKTPDDIERTVREAAERWKDTLPKDYLGPEELALYERLYGPPLRETEPEDVGIPAHADMAEDGQFEEVEYETADDQASQDQATASAEGATLEAVDQAPTYVDAVARNPREHAALLKLSQDFEAAQRKQREREQSAAWPPEEEWDDGDYRSGQRRRFHRHTLQGHFHESPVEILLPKEHFVEPIRELLARSNPGHVKTAAEEAFGGRGLPTSPTTPAGLRKGKMVGVGLHPDKRHMTEIQADAFVAGYLPPAYASVLSILREVRRRLGSHWLQSRLKMGQDGGLSVLDVGGAGAGLVAWEEVLRAEWEVLKENGEVGGEHPPQWKKTAVIGSERLRNRVKVFLENTTFLPRLPDYEHSGETQGEHLDAGDTPQPRKQYDIIIASHLFLQEQVGHRRQAVLNSLWSTLSKDGGILIVIEKPHPRGFEAMAHVRDTVLKQFLLPESGEPNVDPKNFNPAFHREQEPGHVIAPCTSQGTCPMYKEPGESQGRKDACHFHQRFVQPSFYMSVVGGGKGRNQGDVRFSYVAIRRGVPKPSPLSGKEATRRAFDGYEKSQETPHMQTLPRLILQPLKRTRHITMDVCTAEGNLERWTVPKSYSKQAYHDARKSQWGDLWALGAKTRICRRVRVGRGVEKRDKGSGKKPHKVAVTMEGGRMYTKEKNRYRDGPRERGGKKKDAVQELMEAEEREEAMISREIDEEAEEDEEDEDEFPRRSKQGKRRRR